MSAIYSKLGLQAALQSVSVAPSVEPQAVSLLMAERALTAGLWEEADSLVRPLMNGPLRLQALVIEARVAVGRGPADMAGETLGVLAAEFGPRAIPSDLLVVYGRFLARVVGTEQALEFLEAAEPAPIPELLGFRATLLAKRRRFKEAIHLVEIWIPRAPESARPDLRILIARLAILSGDHARAVRIFAIYLTKVRGDQRIYTRAARAALRSCSPVWALKWLGVVQALGPSRRPIHQLAAGIYILNGNLPMAAHSLRVALQLGNEIEDRILLAAVEIIEGHHAAANALLAEALARKPNDPAATFWAGISSRKAPEPGFGGGGQRPEDQPLDQGGISPGMLRLFGLLLIRDQSMDAAAHCLRAVLRRFPHDGASKTLLEECETHQGPATVSGAPGVSETGQTYVIPHSFRVRPEAYLQPAHDGFWTSLKIQGRIIGALIIRETNTRFAKHTLGHFWAVIELLFVVFTHAFFWMIMGARAPGGFGTIEFLTTGILPFYMFQGVFVKTLGAIKGNRALLTYPSIKPLDLALARLFLEYVTTILAFICCIIILNVFGSTWIIPSNPMPILIIMALLAIQGFGVGLIIEALSAHMESLKTLGVQSLRLLYFISTIFYPFSQIPDSLQAYLWWNPLVHAISLMRWYFVQSYSIAGMSWGYLGFSTMVLLGLGLVAERALRPALLSR